MSFIILIILSIWMIIGGLLFGIAISPIIIMASVMSCGGPNVKSYQIYIALFIVAMSIILPISLTVGGIWLACVTIL